MIGRTLQKGPTEHQNICCPRRGRVARTAMGKELGEHLSVSGQIESYQGPPSNSLPYKLSFLLRNELSPPVNFLSNSSPTPVWAARQITPGIPGHISKKIFFFLQQFNRSHQFYATFNFYLQCQIIKGNSTKDTEQWNGWQKWNEHEQSFIFFFFQNSDNLSENQCTSRWSDMFSDPGSIDNW